jgi:hypothetical protein
MQNYFEKNQKYFQGDMGIKGVRRIRRVRTRGYCRVVMLFWEEQKKPAFSGAGVSAQNKRSTN